MATIVLPTRAGVPHYDYSIELDGRAYRLELRWNARVAAWFLTVADPDGGALLAGRRIVIDFPLLARFRNPDLPAGEITAIDMSGQRRDPGFRDLGDRVRLLYFERASLPLVEG